MLMALKERELQNQMSGFTPRDQADNQFRYDQLANQLKIAELNTQANDPRLQVERERQINLNQRELQAAQEAWDYNETAAKTKAGQYNALLDQIESEAKELEKRKDFGFDDPVSRKAVADKHRRDKWNELLQSLPLDKRPGDITPNPATRRFEAVLPPRPGGQQQGGYNPLNIPTGTPAGNNQPLPGLGGGPMAGRMVTVRLPDGTVGEVPADKQEALWKRYPGARFFDVKNQGTSTATKPVQQPQQPSQQIPNTSQPTTGEFRYGVPRAPTGRAAQFAELQKLLQGASLGYAPIRHSWNQAMGYSDSNLPDIARVLESGQLKDIYGYPLSVPANQLEQARALLDQLYQGR